MLCGSFYEAIFFKSCLVLFFLVFFSPFSTAFTSFGEERSSISAFRTLGRFALVWFCLFPLPLGVWEGLGPKVNLDSCKCALTPPPALDAGGFTLLTVLRR